MGDIREVAGALRLGRTGCTPQEGHDLGAGAGGVGAEVSVIRARGDTLLRRPLHRVVEVVVGLDVHEVVQHGVVVHEGDLDLDLARRHGEGVLAIFLGELELLAVLVQNGQSFQRSPCRE